MVLLIIIPFLNGYMSLGNIAKIFRQTHLHQCWMESWLNMTQYDVITMYIHVHSWLHHLLGAMLPVPTGGAAWLPRRHQGAWDLFCFGQAEFVCFHTTWPFVCKASRLQDSRIISRDPAQFRIFWTDLSSVPEIPRDSSPRMPPKLRRSISRASVPPSKVQDSGWPILWLGKWWRLPKFHPWIFLVVGLPRHNSSWRICFFG